MQMFDVSVKKRLDKPAARIADYLHAMASKDGSGRMLRRDTIDDGGM